MTLWILLNILFIQGVYIRRNLKTMKLITKEKNEPHSCVESVIIQTSALLVALFFAQISQTWIIFF